MQPEPMTPEQIEAAVKTAIEEAVSFVDAEIAPDRIRAQRYFSGETDLGHEEGRSRVVATKVRDTVRALKPALMRVFFQAEKPVEFVPRGPEDVDAAEQATDYAAWKFEACGGFKLLQSAFHDALLKKVGVLKVWHEEAEDVEIEEYVGLVDEQVAMLARDEAVQVVEHAAREGVVDTPQGPIPVRLHDMKIAKTSRRGEIKCKAIAPEDFFVDAEATDCEDAFVIGHHTRARVGDLVAMGYDFERVYELSGDAETPTQEEEDFVRRGWSDHDQGDLDPSMRPILLTEAYMRMDVEGTGVPRLYRFVCGGQTYEVLDYDLADDVPFATFEVDPEPHTFYGRSVADILMNEQDTATSLLRGLIDNVAMVNTPQRAYKRGAVDVDDLLNGEIGGLIACDNPQTDVVELITPPTVQGVLPAMQYFDEIVEMKSGVTRAGMGMDADALQSTTAAGVNAAVQAASAAAELIARNLAEGGTKRLFKLIAALAVKVTDPGEMVRLNGKFVPVDPRTWNMSMDMACNVGLGTGARAERMAALASLTQLQRETIQAYGPDNGIIGLTNYRNALADLLKLQGIPNADRYLAPMDPQREAELLQQMQQEQAGGQEGDPNAAYERVEMTKAQARAQADAGKLAIDAEKMRREDDRKRDEMEQDAMLEAAKLRAETGARITAEEIRAQQARDREMIRAQQERERQAMQPQRAPQQ